MGTKPHKGNSGRNCHVICICKGVGFPFGLAQTRRIRLIGRGVLAEGVRFTVLHIGGSSIHYNMRVAGEYDGIAYEYLPGILKRPDHSLARKSTYLRGTVLALRKVHQVRSGDNDVCVYAWVGRGMYGIMFKLMLMAMGVPVVQEVNEWWPGRMEWVRNFVNLAVTRGTLAISRAIEERLSGICMRFSLVNRIIRVPVLADIEGNRPVPATVTEAIASPYVLWCGNIAGYMRDIEFMLQGMLLVNGTGNRCRLALCGSKSADSDRAVKDFMEKLGLPRDSVLMTGYISDEDLEKLMEGAQALLLPLWDDDRSRCRFPNKLGEYLFSGRPVITSRVGDLQDFLVDRESAHLCRPGDVADFAERICIVLRDTEGAEFMGRSGKAQGINNLHWRSNAGKIADFFRAMAVAGAS